MMSVLWNKGANMCNVLRTGSIQNKEECVMCSG